MRVRAVIATISAALASTIVTACGSDSTGPSAPPLVWSTVPSTTTQNLYSVWGTSSTDVWAVGQGTVLHYDGAHWLSVITGTAPMSNGATDQTFLGVWSSSPSDVWVVGHDASLGFEMIHYDGSSWSTWISSTPSFPTAVWGSSASDVWAVYNDGTTIHFGGLGWAKANTGNTEALNAVWGSSRSDVWAVGHQTILHYNGTSWTRTSTSNTLNAVWGSSPWVWAVGVEGMLQYNGGIWGGSTSEVGVPDVPKAVWGTSQNNAWVVTTNSSGSAGGKIVHFNGTKWTDATIGTLPNLHGVWGSSASDVWIVGEGGTILHGTPGGEI